MVVNMIAIIRRDYLLSSECPSDFSDVTTAVDLSDSTMWALAHVNLIDVGHSRC